MNDELSAVRADLTAIEAALTALVISLRQEQYSDFEVAISVISQMLSDGQASDPHRAQNPLASLDGLHQRLRQNRSQFELAAARIAKAGQN
jgi:hypothetical protein